jgi:hypothetical protein
MILKNEATKDPIRPKAARIENMEEIPHSLPIIPPKLRGVFPTICPIIIAITPPQKPKETNMPPAHISAIDIAAPDHNRKKSKPVRLRFD